MRRLSDTAEFRRNSHGRFAPSAETRERDAQALALHGLGHSDQQIAEQFGVTRQAVGQMRRRALDLAGRDTREQALAAELAKLDGYEMAALAVLHAEHVTVSQGRVVTVDGRPLPDDGPVLAALDRLVKVVQERAKLRGLYAPTKVEVADSTTLEIERLAAELGVVDGERPDTSAGLAN